MAGQEDAKWEGKLTANIKGVNQEKIWQTLVEDFSNAHKWYPGIDESRHVDGPKGEVGEVRYVASAAAGEEAEVTWCRERLVKVDHGGRSLSYEVTESNAGIKGYVAVLTVLGSDGEDESRCRIEWSYVTDPIEGMTKEGFFGYITFTLQGMAGKLEKELQSA